MHRLTPLPPGHCHSSSHRHTFYHSLLFFFFFFSQFFNTFLLSITTRLIIVRFQRFNHQYDCTDLPNRTPPLPPNHCHSPPHRLSLYHTLLFSNFFTLKYFTFLPSLISRSIFTQSQRNYHQNDRTDLPNRLVPLPPNHCHSCPHRLSLYHSPIFQNKFLQFFTLSVYAHNSLNNRPISTKLPPK
jgi:hypothetical protein